MSAVEAVEAVEGRLRRATPADLEMVVEMRAVMFAAMGAKVDESWLEPARAWFAANFDDPDLGIFFIEWKGRVVSCGVGQIRRTIPSAGNPSGVDVYVNTVVTREEARGRGFARAVTQAVLDWGRSRGATRAELLATPAGRPIYEGLSFAEFGNVAMRAPLTDRS
ncbi:Predicted acetyltransferase [Trueperella bialowiezensis]|uniref:Predicted acetyltransferase n=2 Tax=Trueperella bialowiezensis TaxID=312285 RepID=A0A448PDH6_9ACTO|nr:Predicted acetyltransferase [Trueperella bialowiezensis]